MDNEKIKEKLLEKSIPIPFSGCLIWEGYVDKDGYGRIVIDGKACGAHRVSFLVFKGMPSKNVCHTCDVPSCINPNHLYDGTHSQNMIDRRDRNRDNKALGVRNGLSVFTFEEICKMRSMHKNGFSLREIANHFGRKGTGYFSLVINFKLRITA